MCKREGRWQDWFQNYLTARETQVLNGAESRTTPKRNHRAVQRIPGAGTPELSIHLGPAGQDLLLSHVVWMSPWAHGAGRAGKLMKHKVSISCFQLNLLPSCNWGFFSPLVEIRHLGILLPLPEESAHTKGTINTQGDGAARVWKWN